jgi:hypothetical protein
VLELREGSVIDNDNNNDTLEPRREPSLVAVLDDLRRNASHTTPEWLELRLPLLLRAVAAEHPEVRLLVPQVEPLRRARP